MNLAFLHPSGIDRGSISEGPDYRPSLGSKRLLGPRLAHEQPKRTGAAGMLIGVVTIAAASAVGLAAMR